MDYVKLNAGFKLEIEHIESPGWNIRRVGYASSPKRAC
jgi:hypothetical protein